MALPHPGTFDRRARDAGSPLAIGLHEAGIGGVDEAARDEAVTAVEYHGLVLAWNLECGCCEISDVSRVVVRDPHYEAAYMEEVSALLWIEMGRGHTGTVR